MVSATPAQSIRKGERAMDYRERKGAIWQFAIDGKEILGIPELLALPDVVPEDGETWGNWTFRRGTLLLEYRNSQTGDDYEIDLEDIHSPLALVIVLTRMDAKCFISPTDIGNLFRAIQDLASHPWYNEKSDLTELIAKRVGAIKSTRDSGPRRFATCPDCGKPMSGSALLCRVCYVSARRRGASIYRAAKERGESSDRSSPRPSDVPPRPYHKRSDQKR